MKALEVQGVSFRYRGSERFAVSDLELRVDEGEFVLVTGPSGSGKSTLLRLLSGLIPHFYEGELHGKVEVLGWDTRDVRPNRLAVEVGSVFQFPEEQIVASRVWRDVAFGLENLLLDREEILGRVDEALGFVGLLDRKDWEVFSLSGGQKQRLAIASILAMQPRLLLLDEPAAELDPAGRDQILRLLTGIAEDRSRTIIVADHRLEGLAGLVDRVIVLLEGRVVMDGSPEEVVPREDLERMGVEVPAVVRLWKRLRERGLYRGPCPMTVEELARRIEQIWSRDHG